MAPKDKARLKGAMLGARDSKGEKLQRYLAAGGYPGPTIHSQH